MNYTCVTKYLLEQMMEVTILENFFLLCPVSPKNSLKKSLRFYYSYKPYLYLMVSLFCQIKEIEKISTKCGIEYKMQIQLLVLFLFSLFSQFLFCRYGLFRQQQYDYKANGNKCARKTNGNKDAWESCPTQLN